MTLYNVTMSKTKLNLIKFKHKIIIITLSRLTKIFNFQKMQNKLRKEFKKKIEEKMRNIESNRYYSKNRKKKRKEKEN